MRVLEEIVAIGLTVVGDELLEVSGRAGSHDGLWLRRISPSPCLEYGVVRFPLSARPLHSASMWTSDWSPQARAELARHAVAVYRDWITDGCPVRAVFPGTSEQAVVV